MEKELSNTDMDKDVTEYTEMEKKIATNFLNGLIKLGEILKRHRDKWKKERKYLDYLKKIGRSVSTTNQIIRTYEYSIKNGIEKLIEANITGWDRLQLFLALPGEEQNKLAEEINGEEIEAGEFREKVSEVKEIEEDGFLLPNCGESVESLIAESSLLDIEFLAKNLVTEMKKSNESIFTDKSEPLATGFLYLEKAKRYLEAKEFKKLSYGEKTFWSKAIAGQIEKLNKLLHV